MGLLAFWMKNWEKNFHFGRKWYVGGKKCNVFYVYKKVLEENG